MSIRTVQASPIKGSDGKWACVFKMFRTASGEEYLASEATTPPLWHDMEAALVAGDRALQVLEETGEFPNMCEIW